MIRDWGGDGQSRPHQSDCFQLPEAPPHRPTLPFCFSQSVRRHLHSTNVDYSTSSLADECLCSASVSQYSDENMMQPYNLAVCFGPSLLRGMDADDAVTQQPQVNDLVKTMILQHDLIFPSQAELPGPVYEKHMTLEQEYWWGGTVNSALIRSIGFNYRCVHRPSPKNEPTKLAPSNIP